MGIPRVRAEGVLQDGDLVVGAGVPLPFQETRGRILTVRHDEATVFCESPADALDPLFWNIPSDVLVDSDGRVVFLAWMGSFQFAFQDWGLFRCSADGSSLELLGILPSTPGSPTDGRPVPFPGEYFETVAGLHLSRTKSLLVDDDVGGGLPRLTTEDAYTFAVATWTGSDPRTRVGIRSLRYRATTGIWEEGPGPVTEGLLGGYALPDLTDLAGDTYVALHTGPRTDGRGQLDMIRRLRAPLRFDARGAIGDVRFEVRLDLFGGHLDIGGGVTTGSFAEIAATSFVLDDLNVPNPVVCSPAPPVSAAVPYGPGGGGYSVPTGFLQIAFEEGGLGLVVTSNSGAAGTPYLANIDLAGLNDDPSDDISQFFLRPELGCVAQRSIKFRSILPFASPGGVRGNSVERLAVTSRGLVGTQHLSGEVVRVREGDSVEPLIGGLFRPLGIAGYPPIIRDGRGVAVVVRVDSPVNALITGPDGRRVGVNSTDEALNDFGLDGFDSGAGEPRFLGFKNPVVGEYRLDTFGIGSGPYRLHLWAVNLETGDVTRVRRSGSASAGSRDQDLFRIAIDGSLLPAISRFRRGDSNADGATDISDAVHALGVLFLGSRGFECPSAADANDDGVLDISDPIATLGFLFLGHDLLPPPGSICGEDPTSDALDCPSYLACPN